MANPTVLIVDDEPDLIELVSLTLSRMHLATAAAGDLGGARALLQSRRFDLCLTDMRLPDGDGLDLVAWIQQHHPQLPVAVITAHGNVESAVRALKLGAFDFVSKPLDLGVLRKLVATAIKLGERDERQDAEVQASLVRGPQLLGESRAMHGLRELIGRVARSQAPVHICGESGTGKELVARLIHERGARHDGPFVPVNCGAIPSELMESELFGHKRGSFTGAVADKQGLIQSAEGGTLFLDEVADLPLHMQVKLLRVIQEKAVRPVGEQREIPVDVRILSATHKNLAELVAQGRFREDLYYRIDVIEIRVPSLREHSEDIPALAQHVLRRLTARNAQEAPALGPEARAALQVYPFPGNVRELENILERAVALCAGGHIGVADLQLRQPPAAGAAQTLQPGQANPRAGTPGHFSTGSHEGPAPGWSDAGHAPPPPGSGSSYGPALSGAVAHAGNSGLHSTLPHAGAAGPTTPLGDQLETIEREAILKALEQTRYNKTAAAKLLGMSFRALRYRVKKLGIE